jgi:hypothetical protein
VLNAHAWDPIETKRLCRLVARFAVSELVAATNKEGIAKTTKTNRRSDLPHMSGIEFVKLSDGGSKLFEPNVGKVQTRQHVVASPMPRGRERHSFLALASAAALLFQLFAESWVRSNQMKGHCHVRAFYLSSAPGVRRLR